MKGYYNQEIIIAFLLLAIWTLCKFLGGIYSIPIWILLLFLVKFKYSQIASILFVSEFYTSIDSYTLGPFSFIQIIGLLLIPTIVQKLKVWHFKNFITILTIFIVFYYSISYFSYFKNITHSTFNWFFLLIIAVTAFEKNTLVKLKFYFTLAFISITIIAFINFLVSIIYGEAYTKIYAFGNATQIGFYSLIAIVYSLYIKRNTNEKIGLSFQILFWFNVFYILYSGSRLNFLILIILFTFFLLHPTKEFVFSRRNLFIIYLITIIAFVSSDFISNYLFRQTNNRIKDLTFNSLDDLNDSDLRAFTSARSAIYYDAIHLIKEKPIFGNGFLSWNDKNNNFNSIISGQNGTRISMHSTFLQYWAETGIFGLSMYVLLLLMILKYSYVIKKSHEYKQIGTITYLFTLAIIIGSTLDNHSLSYSQIQLISGISIILFKTKLHS